MQTSSGIIFSYNLDYIKKIEELTKEKLELEGLYSGKCLEIVQLTQKIEESNKIIDILKNERDELKSEIHGLETKINELKNENLTLKNNIITLENNVIEINDKFDKLNMKYVYNKYLTAIQDLNRELSIEKNINSINAYMLSQNFVKLRKARVDVAHYIDKDDTSVEKSDRIYFLREMLNNMPNNVRVEFDRKFTPYVLIEVEKYIKSYTNISSSLSYNDISEWWE